MRSLFESMYFVTVWHRICINCPYDIILVGIDIAIGINIDIIINIGMIRYSIIYATTVSWFDTV